MSKFTRRGMARNRFRTVNLADFCEHLINNCGWEPATAAQRLTKTLDEMIERGTLKAVQASPGDTTVTFDLKPGVNRFAEAGFPIDLFEPN